MQVLKTKRLQPKAVRLTLTNQRILAGFKKSLMAKLVSLKGENYIPIEHLPAGQRENHVQELHALVTGISRMYGSFLVGLNQDLERPTHSNTPGRRVALLKVRSMLAAVGIEIRTILREGLIAQIGEAKQAIEDAVCSGRELPGLPKGMPKEMFTELSGIHRTLALVYDHIILNPKD